MNKKIIKNKIKSTGSIKKITRTMEMVSVAKMKKALTLADAYKPFSLEVFRLLNILSKQREKHIYTEHRESGKTLIILVAGEKGLCGSYNTNIYKKISKTYKNKSIESSNAQLDFVCIGKYADRIARRVGGDIKMSFEAKKFSSSAARSIVNYLSDSYIKNIYSNVDIVYTSFTNVNNQEVVSLKLLPFSKENLSGSYLMPNDTDIKLSENDYLEYTFEPNIHQVFAFSVNILLQNIILGSVLISAAAEHSARMAAMKTATDNASEMLGELKLWYNKARQAAITQEIAEISSAASN